MHLRDYQQALTDYIRGKSDIKVFNEADVYRNLFQKNIVNFLRENKPELVEVLADDFDDFVLEFFKNWQCKTPFFYEIQGEFTKYCQNIVANN